MQENIDIREWVYFKDQELLMLLPRQRMFPT